jgi:uncharacterized protein YjbJ (UPF0337 family)
MFRSRVYEIIFRYARYELTIGPMAKKTEEIVVEVEQKSVNQEPSLKQEKPLKPDGFAQTAGAAKLSGTFHQTVGAMKRTIGRVTDNEELKLAGENQELLGKVHELVGVVRDIRATATNKINEKRAQGIRILRTHSGKLVGGITEFARDIKKLLD